MNAQIIVLLDLTSLVDLGMKKGQCQNILSIINSLNDTATERS